ncbi:uncharacterized protein CELE_W02A2.8 [Caenorhabditis elegans]|nr:Uncharacterized protein CELE_W02A2.8 [Caenorhabditis elegans]CBY25208.1 Uncharacterized protein CELE_W02A2.8 [Caenorhabditis elegans]|eukprot:NP_001255731.1 Uncharacterized protein CELE_W02A2.8 [Caenorhabditis elegans]
MLRKLWKRPHSTWNKITAVTNVSSEKTITDGQLSEKARKDVDHDVDRTIYDIPLEYCHLRIPKSRTSRSCPDPWRRYGAHVKLCEVGGWMPENRNKNSKVIVVKKGSAPPAAPRCKPLMTVEDYLGVLRK